MNLDITIDILESTNVIRRLIAQYGLAFDTHNRALLKSIFHGDAVMASDPGEAAEGIDAIMAAAEALWARMPRMHHWLSEPIVDVDGDVARAVTACHALVVDADDGPLEISGRYTDDFRRQDGQWRFARRSFEMRYATPLSGWRPAMGTDL